MVIQVVAREIREARRMHVHGVDTAEIESVGRRFKRDVGATKALELSEHREQVERFGRGVYGRQHASRQVILNGAYQRGCLSGGPQHGVNQSGGGGFAVCACDAG